MAIIIAIIVIYFIISSLKEAKGILRILLSIVILYFAINFPIIGLIWLIHHTVKSASRCNNIYKFKYRD